MNESPLKLVDAPDGYVYTFAAYNQLENTIYKLNQSRYTVVSSTLTDDAYLLRARVTSVLAEHHFNRYHKED